MPSWLPGTRGHRPPHRSGLVLNHVIVTKSLDEISNDFQRIFKCKSEVHKYPNSPGSVFKKRDVIRLLDVLI